VEVDQVGNALAIKKPVPMQLIYQSGQWRAQCAEPPVATLKFDSMEEAIVAGAKEAAAELQSEVDDRALIVGQITPESIAKDMF